MELSEELFLKLSKELMLNLENRIVWNDKLIFSAGGLLNQQHAWYFYLVLNLYLASVCLGIGSGEQIKGMAFYRI